MKLSVITRRGMRNKYEGFLRRNHVNFVAEPARMALERDVTLSTLYGVPAVMILRHQSEPQTAEVHVHTLNGPGQAPVKTHVLKLGVSGRFAINIVDDLILVHHQVCIQCMYIESVLI